ncbi:MULTISPECIES: hypothetical protein [unclassified Inquilinus]|uniref:hypothetical protein n=1 Tax=unclassified Inquilinus TaxID=2645927 RepID=UPI003F90C9D6
MSYSKDLETRIRNRKAWPYFSNPDFLNTLDQLAEEAHSHQTIDGYLAGLLVHHQLIEEMTRLLVECSHLFIQMSIYPVEIQFKERSRPMMGYWISQLEETIEFDYKLKFIESAKKFNSVRNAIFHGITKHSSHDDIIEKIKPTLSLYNDVYHNFLESYDWFCLSFKDWRKDADEIFAEEEE